MNIRSDIGDFSEYVPVQSAEALALVQKMTIDRIDKLDAGENVWGPSPYVMRALSRFKGYQFYPDPSYFSLREKLATYTEVERERIFISNGGDEFIDLLLRLVLNEGDKVIDIPPTFSSYKIAVLLNRGVVVNVPRREDFSIDVEAVLRNIDETVKMVFICNPNNPTGTVTSRSEIERILKKGTFVCVDEAYIEFGGQSCVPLLRKYDNLIILRSFSKWAGIAGLRLGYGLASETIVRQLMKIKQPYNVNIAAVIAGIASLEDESYRVLTIGKIKEERDRMYRAIMEMKSYRVTKSCGNFIFLQASQTIIDRVQREFVNAGIAVRTLSVNGATALRITIGKPSQNNRVLSVLEASQNAPEYDALLFDMDGVLVDVTQSYRIAIQKTARFFLGRNVEMNEVNGIKAQVGMNNDWDATYALIGNKDIPYQEVKEYFQKLYLGSGKKPGLIKKETLLISRKNLISLRNKYGKMAIVTGRPRAEAEYVLKRFKLEPIFDLLIAKEDCRREKPSPDPILKAMRLLKSKKPVYIGDSPSDSEAASRAQIPCLYIGTNDNVTQQFKSLSELYEYLI